MTRTLIVTFIIAFAVPVYAADGPPVNALRGPGAADRHPIAPRASAGDGVSSGGWWLGGAGVVLALGVLGGIGLAWRRGASRDPATGVAVVGRASLSPRHSLALVKVAGRTYLI